MYSIVAVSVPTDPQAIAAYTLLAWFGAMIWIGNRRSGAPGVQDPNESDLNPDLSSQATDLGESPLAGGSTGNDGGGGHSGWESSKRPKGRKKLTRAQRRRRGNINWIQ